MLWRDVGGDQGPGDPPEQFAQLRNAVRLPLRGQAVDSRFPGGVQPGGGLLAGGGEREAGSRRVPSAPAGPVRRTGPGGAGGDRPGRARLPVPARGVLGVT